MDSLCIVMPAYNEEQNIEKVVRQWYTVLYDKGEKSKIIVADSGSTDATHEILVRLQKEYTRLEVLSNTEKQHGPKVIALYNYATSICGIDYIFQTDSDGQTDPAEFQQFWNNRKRYDAILGYRRVRGDGAQRAWVERVVCWLLRIFFGVKIQDANAPYRLMKTDLVKKYLCRLPQNYNLPNIMLTTYFAYYNEKICFKEITFRPRQGGKNSINIPKIIKIGWKALGDFWTFRRNM